MIFKRSKKTVSRNMWRMDKLVTGIVLGWAAAGIFGLSRTTKGRKFWKRTVVQWEIYAKKWVSIFGKTTAKIISFFSKK
jgi:hypothetical protein